MPGTKEKIIQVVQSNQSKIVNGILVLGGIYITYRLGKKIIDGINKKDTQTKADDSPEVRQAMALRSAMNPSGISWMMSFDTTNTNSIFNIYSSTKISRGIINIISFCRTSFWKF